MTEEARQKRNEYMRKWKNKPENKERIKEYHRQWRANNPDKVAAAQKRYWEKVAMEASS